MRKVEVENQLDSLREYPQELLQLTRDLSDTDMRHKEQPEEFSVLENICHLRDIEIEGYTARINRILGEERPLLPDIDGRRLASERNYNSQDPKEALQSFTNSRLRNIQVLSALSSEQLDREGILEKMGTVTLRKLLLMIREHDQDHGEDIRKILARRSQAPGEAARA